MSDKVVVVATFVAKPDRVDDIERISPAVIAPTHAEEGCERYALHRDTSDPNRFVLVEVWRSQEDLDRHFTQPHMALLADLQDALVDSSVHFLEPVPYGDATKGAL